MGSQSHIWPFGALNGLLVGLRDNSINSMASRFHPFFGLWRAHPGIEGCVHAGHEQPTDVFRFLSKAFSQQHWLIVGRIGES